MKIGDDVRGLNKMSWLRGKIIGINDENGAIAVKTKEGVICALFRHEVQKESA